MFGWFRKKDNERYEDNELCFYLTKEDEIYCRLSFRKNPGKSDIVQFGRFLKFLHDGKLFTLIMEAASNEKSPEGNALVKLLQHMNFDSDPQRSAVVDPTDVFSTPYDSDQ